MALGFGVVASTRCTQRVSVTAALFFLQALPCYAQQRVEVVIQNYRFTPQEVRIQPGDTVRWLNRERRTSHSIVFSDSGVGASERLFPDESWQHRFERAGVYRYHCDPHPEMTGTVVVLEPSGAHTCQGASDAPNRRLRIAPDDAGVQILQAGGVVRQLSLRPGLLSDVHYVDNGRHALLAARDGWILRLDLEQGKLAAEVHLGHAVSGTALSQPRATQGPLLAVVGHAAPVLTILDEHLRIAKTLPVVDKTGRPAPGLARVQTSAVRESFVTLLVGAPELWEISYNRQAPEIGLGMVHDFQYREGQFVPGYLNIQRSTLPSAARDFVLLDSQHEVLTSHARVPEAANAVPQLHITHLDVRKPTSERAPAFYPDKPGTAWRQVDPRTLPQGTSTFPLRVNNSTHQFLLPPNGTGTNQNRADAHQRNCAPS